jgi:hypothetical protein
MFLQNLRGEEFANTASFLKIGAGAKATALGGAFVAVADDASAGYWNPAGLAQLKGPIISLADRIPEMDTSYANMAIASPIWHFGVIGLNAIYYGVGNVATYDDNGANTGTLTDREAAVILSYAYNLNQLLLGINMKYIYQEMNTDDIGSSIYDGIGADVAILYKVYEHLTVGANFHSKFKMTGDNDTDMTNESPMNIRAGAYYKANIGKNNLLNFMIDLNQTKAYPLKLHCGTELVLYDSLALRVGLDDLYAETNGIDINPLDLIKHNVKPTIGLGFKWKIGKNTTESDSKQSAIIFDYALSMEKLGMRNFFTLAYQF